jgi:iron complex transport system permease protein
MRHIRLVAAASSARSGIWIIPFVLCVGSAIFSLSAGARWVPLGDSARLLAARAIPALGIATPAEHEIIWNYRVPRVLLAAMVGAALAVAGVTVQTAVRNPLGDPYILGVSSGACLGAILLMCVWPGAFHGSALFVAAFVGGMTTSAIVYGLASQRGTIAPRQLVLAGIAATYLLNSGISLCLLQVDRQSFGATNNFLFWSMGSFARAGWIDLPIPALTLLLALGYLLLQSRVLDALNLDDESCHALGLNPGIERAKLFVVVSLLVAASVACAGQVGFVGLMIPHISRLFCGSGHCQNLSSSAFLGATCLLLADALARTAYQPQEIPVGVLTAVLGAPFFIVLLRRSDGGLA